MHVGELGMCYNNLKKYDMAKIVINKFNNYLEQYFSSKNDNNY